MISYTIEKARLNDAHSIGALITSCWQNSYKDIIDEDYLNSLNPIERSEFITNALISGKFLGYCAFCNRQIVGVCLLKTSSITGLPGYGELSCLYVDEKFNNIGIGEKLLSLCTDYMVSIGLNYVILNVLSQNLHAIDFYKKRGFVVIALNQVELGDKTYPFLLMRKKII